MQYAGKRVGLEAKGANPAELDARAMALTLRAEEIRNGIFYGLLKAMVSVTNTYRRCSQDDVI